MQGKARKGTGARTSKTPAGGGEFQHALWGRDGALTSDLGKSSKIGTCKAHELGWGTCSRRRDGHCYRMRVLVREAFWEAK